MSPSILEIPDLPMEMIINDLDYLSIQSVRKTCWDLRNFIDDQKPKIWMKTITIHEMNDEVIMSCNFPTLGLSGFIHLFYEKHENGCLIQGATSDGYKYKIVEKLNFVDAAFHDFNIALNFQKSIFEKVNHFLQFHEYKKYLKVVKDVRKHLFIDAFGETFKPPGEYDEIWYFNVLGNKEKVLKVVNSYKEFRFRFVKKCEVPEGYVIIN
ncbi:hypothetical protein GCK72_021365 [Caenorhabditis remanei]|uniref:F-box domain-containing protein n=1 Tax=Caenorhabditis remanei TaxID=31234 RepID=A0A6A5GJM7_CAERE|nr:hypothetical protein GCK72_021365 [Caenorhabditis remanei]KAF1754801.1 hypothetical protein GCK72_021365 [Caenorhabditis remanei]